MEGEVVSGAMEVLGQVVTAVIGYMGELVDVIVAEPILLLPVGIFVVGGAIGLASRLIGR